MSWNRPNTVPSALSPTGAGRKKSVIRCILAGAIVVVAAVAAWLILAPSEPSKHSKPTKPSSLIKEVKPLVQTNAVPTVAEVKPMTNELSEAWQKFHDGRDTNRWIVLKDPKTGKDHLYRRSRPGFKGQPKPLYENHALNILDAIAFKPIISPMAVVRIDDKFMQNFQNAMVEKIEIKSDDSEEVKQRKQAMIDLLTDLKKRLRDGEDIRQTIKDSLAERNSVAALKRMMQNEIRTMRESGASEEEIEEFGNACNEKLVEKGALPLMTQKVMEQRIKEREEREMQKEKSK